MRGERPLDGIRVLDLSRAVSGPYAGRLLADLGADVVKLEPPDGDMTRHLGQIRHGLSGLYTQLNAGKRNICIDLDTPEGRDLARHLVGAADVVVENFRPGVLDRLGLGWSDLSALHPQLVMLSITGFGQTGPDAARRAFAPVVHAESGVLGRQSEADQCGPHDLVLGLADSLAGLHGVIAVLAALRLRDRTGDGQHIDMAMLDALLASDDYMHHVGDESFPIWPVRGQVWAAPGGPIMVAADPKKIWADLARHFGLTDGLASDTDLRTKVAARADIVAAWFRSFATRPELIAALDDAGLAWGDLRHPADLADSPSVQARRLLVDIDDRGGGQRRVVQSPYRFSAAEVGVRGPAPYRGEHNASVLRTWLTPPAADDAIEKLSAAGALQVEPSPAQGRSTP